MAAGISSVGSHRFGLEINLETFIQQRSAGRLGVRGYPYLRSLRALMKPLEKLVLQTEA
jgi:hypothetical protein